MENEQIKNIKKNGAAADYPTDRQTGNKLFFQTVNRMRRMKGLPMNRMPVRK